VVLQACLNGDREGPDIPRSPGELADAARACVAAGATSIHCHPRDGDGHESLAPADVAAALGALRPLGVELSFSSGVWITAGDHDARIRAIEGWTDRPDRVSVNIAEEGWQELVELCAARAIGVEAGVWTPHDAELLAASGFVATWGRGSRGTRHHPPVRRILVEPRSENTLDAVHMAAEIDHALDRGAIPAPRLHHGVGAATWAVLDAAIALGRDIRIGFEDVLTLPDGRRAADNAALVVEAALRYS
jgi:uncharacterized protein (DUF849 family)